MMNGFEPDLFTLTDEDGKEHIFEFLDRMEYNGTTYYALTPHYENPEDILQSDGELVILKDDPANDQLDPENLSLVSIDDEDEFNEVGQILLKRVNDMFEDDDEDDEEL